MNIPLHTSVTIFSPFRSALFILLSLFMAMSFIGCSTTSNISVSASDEQDVAEMDAQERYCLECWIKSSREGYGLVKMESEPEQIKQSEPIHNVPLQELPGFLRNDLKPLPGEQIQSKSRLYALIDLGRIRDEQREKVLDKLKNFKHEPLLVDPRYPQLKWHGALLVFAPNDNADALLDAWGGSDGDVISAWIVSKSDGKQMAKHFRANTLAYDANEQEYLLRYYAPRILPILHREADKNWARQFFNPIIAWWYPVATPTQETWSRIEGGKQQAGEMKMPLILSGELWDAMINDPFPHNLLTVAEQKFPSAFENDCYGVRLAKVESLLKAGKEKGLETRDDLFVYAMALLEEPEREKEPRWQEAVRKAVADEAPLRMYFPNSDK